MSIARNFGGENELVRYQGNNDTCIVICSANTRTMGRVLNVSNEIESILQYVSADLVGQNINQVMPLILSRLHNNFMKSYFEIGQMRTSMHRTVFPLNKAGYLVPCEVVVKTIPNLSDGLKMAGFLKKIEQSEDSSKQDPNFDKTVWNYFYRI